MLKDALARLRELLAAPLTSDAARRRPAYEILATQSGHMLLGLAASAPFILAGETWLGHAICGLVWGVTWEWRQYRTGGGARKVRRRWDWFADAVCYQLGPGWLGAQAEAVASGWIAQVFAFAWASAMAATVLTAAAIIFAAPQDPLEGP